MSYLDEAAAEVRAMLLANSSRYKMRAEGGAHEPVLGPIRAERLLIIDRLIAIGAAEARLPRDGTPKAGVYVAWAFCKRCEAGTASVPCPRDAEHLACAGCGRCPPCDGDLPAEEE